LNQVTKACVDASSKVDAAINQHGMGAKDREPWVFETNSACEENKKLKEQPNLSLSREDSVVIYFHTARRLKIAEYQKEIHAKELLKSEHEIYDKKVDSDWSQCSWTGGPWADTCWSQLMTTKWNDSNDIQVAIDALNLQIDTLKEQTKKPPSLKGNAAS